MNSLGLSQPAGARDGSGSTARLDRFLIETRPPTPCVVIDLDVVRSRYAALKRALPEAEIYYAVKANPAAEIVGALAELGANFDLASPGEIDICRASNIPPHRLSFGNTIKRETAIREAAAQGIGMFAFDSAAELDKLARSAPGARVFCRMLIENAGAEWPLTRKFGCEAHMAVDLLTAARDFGLNPVGVSFHVGSQQTDPHAWARAISHAAWIFRTCAHRGLELGLLNLGGGLPVHYRAPVPPLAAYAETIETALAQQFGRSRPRILIAETDARRTVIPRESGQWFRSIPDSPDAGVEGRSR